MNHTMDDAMPHPFKVARVERADSPNSGEGTVWYRYVLDNGRSTINGRRRGTLKDVTAYATQCTEQLNERSLLGRSIWNPRGRKPAQST
jgi:hypothetical protein